MIPKRAVFFWDGPKISWLRTQSIKSFQRLNPDWKIDVIGGELIQDDRLNVVQKSDWARYKYLANLGGYYFDTDIVFIKPVPKKWLDCDLAMSVNMKAGTVNNIAVLGAAKGNRFFHYADRLCAVQRDTIDYQALGIHLLPQVIKRVLVEHPGANETFENMLKVLPARFFNIPQKAVVPVDFQKVSRLWDGSLLPLPDETIGIHWFGGDELSRKYEALLTAENLGDYPCPVTRALEAA